MFTSTLGGSTYIVKLYASSDYLLQRPYVIGDDALLYIAYPVFTEPLNKRLGRAA